jgi:hypothetical protein
MNFGKRALVLFLASACWAHEAHAQNYSVDAGSNQELIWPTQETVLEAKYTPGAAATKEWTAVGLNAGLVSFRIPDSQTTQATFDKPGSYTLVFTVTWSIGLGGDTTLSDTCLVSVWQAPAIQTQPANATVTAPSGATFTVVAEGFPLPAYQWERFDGSTWIDVMGANSASYSLSGTSASDNGANFRCRLHNTAGTVYSNPAALTVQYAPIISTQPSAATVVAPAGASFSVAASGNPNTLTYQWRRNGADITGANASTYNLPSTQPADNGATFSVVVSNGVGSTTSSSAALTVQYKPQITSHPHSISVTAPAAAAFSVTATGNPAALTYQWTRNGTPISGATLSTYTLSPTTASDNGAVFRVVVSKSAGDSTSLQATLSVNAPLVAPQITTEPVSATVTLPAGASFSAAATGNPTPTFQWQRNSAGTWNNISGATSAGYSLASTAASDNGSQFRVLASNSQGTDTSLTALLTVHFSPTLSAHPVSQTVVAPATAAFSVTVASGARSVLIARCAGSLDPARLVHSLGSATMS